MSDDDTAARVLDTIIAVVPQWFTASSSKAHRYEIRARGVVRHFYSQRRLTRDLRALLAHAQENVEKWCNDLPQPITRSSLSRIGEELAIFWLSISVTQFAWRELFAYFEELRTRTNENAAVSLNLVLNPAAGGTADIRHLDLQKILDPMATHLNTYIRVDHSLRFLAYGEVAWSDIKAPTDYKFNPEFLQPIKSILGDGEMSAHLTSRGDLVFMSKFSIVASCRKSRWYIYEASTMKNALVDIFNHYRAGCNLFELSLDLSYRRHGGLLIYDPQHSVISRIVNPDAKLAPVFGHPPTDRQALCSAVRQLKMGDSASFASLKRRLIELASIDGAVVFDEKEVLAIGAMIPMHPAVGSHHGARTTAAYSALHFGGRPMKVSADGDIVIPFWAKDDKSEIAKLHYL
jgi:hypothetical protein